MRDINRIKPFCDELAELWSQYPDLRFGQMMSNLMQHVKLTEGRDVFYMEDDEFMEVLKEYLR